VKSHISTISELTVVMSMDFRETLNEIHPSLGDSSKGTLQSISNDTLARLTGVIHSLKREKQKRLQKVSCSDLDELVQMTCTYICISACVCMCLTVATC